MRYINVLNISLQQMYIFLKCMEIRNYSKVAEILNYTPSMISKTISTLESALGLVLFVRKYHELIPTPAAKSLEETWNQVINQMELSVEKAHDIQTGRKSSIRIGVIDSSEYAERLLLERLSNLNNNSEVFDNLSLEKADMHDLVGLLKKDRIDIAITAYHERDLLDVDENISWKIIAMTKLAIFIHDNHPLFSKESLSFNDFKKYPFIILNPVINPGYNKLFETVCNHYGFDPLIKSTVSNSSSLRYNLEMGKGLVFGDSIICEWESAKNRKYEIDISGLSGLIIVWKKNHEDAAIRRIVKTITQKTNDS